MGLMPWWATMYTVAIGVLVVAGAFWDWRGRDRPAWHIALDLAAGLALILLIAGRWHDELVTPLGRMAALVLAATLAWDIYSTSRDLNDLRNDPELTPSQNVWIDRAGILVGAALIAPGYALALMGVMTAWRGAA
jgi:hypothetical protein